MMTRKSRFQHFSFARESKNKLGCLCRSYDIDHNDSQHYVLHNDIMMTVSIMTIMSQYFDIQLNDITKTA